MQAQTKRKRGRPTLWSDEVAAQILRRLAFGESLRSICRDDGMPNEDTVLDWSEDPRKPEFCRQYARARQRGYEWMADDLLVISDKDFTGPDGLTDNAAVQAARLQCDNRKWLLSKLLPKQYGDKVTAEIQGDPNAPLVTRIELVPVAPLARTRIDNSIAIEHDDGYDGGSDPSGRNKP